MSSHNILVIQNIITKIIILLKCWNDVYFLFFFSAIVEKYLLEKSRIVSQAKNER